MMPEESDRKRDNAIVYYLPVLTQDFLSYFWFTPILNNISLFLVQMQNVSYLLSLNPVLGPHNYHFYSYTKMFLKWVLQQPHFERCWLELSFHAGEVGGELSKLDLPFQLYKLFFFSILLVVFLCRLFSHKLSSDFKKILWITTDTLERTLDLESGWSELNSLLCHWPALWHWADGQTLCHFLLKRESYFTRPFWGLNEMMYNNLRNTGSFCRASFYHQPGAYLPTVKSRKYMGVHTNKGTFPFYPCVIGFPCGQNPWQAWPVDTGLSSWGVWSAHVPNSSRTDVFPPPSPSCCHLAWLIEKPSEESFRVWAV